MSAYTSTLDPHAARIVLDVLGEGYGTYASCSMRALAQAAFRLDEGNLADRIRAGEPTTYRAIAYLDGYWSARRTLGLSHRQIVEKAKEICAV